MVEKEYLLSSRDIVIYRGGVRSNVAYQQKSKACPKKTLVFANHLL